MYTKPANEFRALFADIRYLYDILYDANIIADRHVLGCVKKRNSIFKTPRNGASDNIYRFHPESKKKKMPFHTLREIFILSTAFHNFDYEHSYFRRPACLDNFQTKREWHCSLWTQILGHVHDYYSSRFISDARRFFFKFQLYPILQSTRIVSRVIWCPFLNVWAQHKRFCHSIIRRQWIHQKVVGSRTDFSGFPITITIRHRVAIVFASLIRSVS